jgi:hypothetical protein
MNGRQFLVVMIITFITVIVWVVFDILHSRSTIKPTQETVNLVKPISPDFDIDALK